jgi:hypothetical protein
MLGNRPIRGLDSNYWEKYKEKVSKPIILGFGLHESKQNTFIIQHPLQFIVKKANDELFSLFFPSYPLDCRLSHHTLLKILLNNMSTLIMGRMNRYESNIMTYVKPTNYKLIDRSARYVIFLRKNTTYEEAVQAIYEIKSKIGVDEPIVLKVI